MFVLLSLGFLAAIFPQISSHLGFMVKFFFWFHFFPFSCVLTLLKSNLAVLSIPAFSIAVFYG